MPGLIGSCARSQARAMHARTAASGLSSLLCVSVISHNALYTVVNNVLRNEFEETNGGVARREAGKFPGGTCTCRSV